MLSKVGVLLALACLTSAFLGRDIIREQRDVAVSNPESQLVTNSAAFTSGAGNTNNGNVHDGIGNAGTDKYNCYYGSWEGFPDKSYWVDFDAMWNNSKRAMSMSCSNLGVGSCSKGDGAFGEGDSTEQIDQTWNSIQQIAEASLVDHRFILATILQESIACVNVCPSENPDPAQPDNPGLMQAMGGVTFVGNSASSASQQSSINQMVIDGTQGTDKCEGLVKCINKYGNIYEAARCYNSGSVNITNLNDAMGATASYVNDIANRMTGWVYTQRKFNQC